MTSLPPLCLHLATRAMEYAPRAPKVCRMYVSAFDSSHSVGISARRRLVQPMIIVLQLFTVHNLCWRFVGCSAAKQFCFQRLSSCLSWSGNIYETSWNYYRYSYLIMVLVLLPRVLNYNIPMVGISVIMICTITCNMYLMLQCRFWHWLGPIFPISEDSFFRLPTLEWR